MNDKYMSDSENRNKYYYNLDEILCQTCYTFDYEKSKLYRDRIEWEYRLIKSSDSPKLQKDKDDYFRILSNHCDTKKKIVKSVLSQLGFDLDDYKDGSHYKIPIMVAELIYIIANHDSSRGTTLSNIHTKGVDSLNEKEKFILKRMLLNEVKKDFPELSTKCEKLLQLHEYMYLVRAEIGSMIQQLKIMQDKLYLPIIPYDSNVDTAIKFLSSNIEPNLSTLLNRDLSVFEYSTDRVFEYGEFDDVIIQTKKSIDNLGEELYFVLNK